MEKRKEKNFKYNKYIFNILERKIIYQAKKLKKN